MVGKILFEANEEKQAFIVQSQADVRIWSILRALSRL
jgi:hypothetical protein